jgi:hypothetical protein
MIIKKRLFIGRDGKTLIINEGDNFEASFDIDSIGGNLTFNLPYIQDYSNLSKFRIDRLRKFDFVFLYYAAIDEDREPNDNEWYKIFNGYIESINLKKTKTNVRYTILCNSMLALSNYYYSYTQITATEIGYMPYNILQKCNLQSGSYNLMSVNQRDIIPAEKLDIKINEIYGTLQVPDLTEKNCKAAIEEFKNKYGLIFTENMDGIVQITTLSNYLTSAGNLEIKYEDNSDESPETKVNNFIPRSMALAVPGVFGPSIAANDLKKIIKGIKDNWVGIKITSAKIFDFIYGSKSPKNKAIFKASAWVNNKLFGTKYSNDDVNSVIDLLSVERLVVNDLLNKGDLVVVEKVKEQISSLGDLREIPDVLQFEADKNIWSLSYPDVSTDYDGVVAYGYQATGKAIDLTSIALKDIQPDAITGKYNLNILKIYRRDINNSVELNKIAREELYKIKQENKISFKTDFLPTYRIGMPFTIIDYDRYTGTELFICTKISYTLSKDTVECTIEGMSSILSLLPEDVVTDNINVADVSILKLDDKIKNANWENSFE